jgi:hypothetical protein
MDCADKTDEIDCDKILFDVAYFKSYPAPPVDPDTQKQNVTVSVHITSILDINEVDSNLKLQFSTKVQL